MILFCKSGQCRRANPEESFVLCGDLPAYDLLFRPNCPRTERTRMRPNLGMDYSEL